MVLRQQIHEVHFVPARSNIHLIYSLTLSLVKVSLEGYGFPWGTESPSYGLRQPPPFATIYDLSLYKLNYMQ